MTDRELLQLYVAERSEDAFAQIVQRYGSLVYRCAKRQTASEAMAEDVTQAVFMLLAQKAPRLKKKVLLAGWLVNTARFAAKAAARTEQRHMHREQEVALMKPVSVDPAAAFQEIRPLLDQALATLTETDRGVVALRYLEGMEFAQVAELVQSQPEAVRKRLDRAIVKLRKFFDRSGHDIAPALLPAVLAAGHESGAPALLLSALSHAQATVSAASTASSIAHAASRLMIHAKVKTSLVLTCVALAVTAAAGATFSRSSRAPRVLPAPTPPAANSNGLSSRLKWVLFTERSPLSATDALYHQKVGEDLRAVTPTDLARSEYDLAHTPFGIFIPSSYRPDTPHGLFVWTGVTEASPEWLDVLAQHKLIFVSAYKINEGQTLDAVHNMKQLYNLDPARIYLSGFSAGGQRGTELLRTYPDVFSGGAFFMGGYFYASLGDEHVRGQRREPSITPNWAAPWRGSLEQIKQRVKIVIVRGQDDPDTWWPEEGQSDYEALTLDGFTRIHLFIIPHWGHTHPDAAWFAKAINALEDAPSTPPTTVPTRDPHPNRAQVAQAQRILTSAQLLMQPNRSLNLAAAGVRNAVNAGNAKKARRFLEQLLEEYPTTPAADVGRKLLDQLDQHSATQKANPPTSSSASQLPKGALR